jgi:hypothetical protein
MSPGVSQHRVSYSLEEALRLTSLPGEEEGRIYCFRRVSLTGIQADAMRSQWMEKTQQTLTALARQSIHGSDPNAGAADAIFFNNLEEAFESLLGKALHGEASSTPPEWFATSLLGIPPQSSYSHLIPVIVDRLRNSLTPGAAASILILALGDRDPAPLLSSIPEDTFRAWLRAFGDADTAVQAPPVQLPGLAAIMIQRAASQVGWRSPTLLWLTTQAVLCASPGAWIHGLAVKKARATLRLLESESRNAPPESNVRSSNRASTRIHGFGDENEIHLAPFPSPEEKADTESAGEQPPVFSETSFVPPTLSSIPQHQPPNSTAVRNTSVVAHAPALLGEVTHAAGLLFLLNVLRHLGIASALQAHPVLAEASLPAHILKRFAAQAAVAENDLILLCLPSITQPFTLPREILAAALPLPNAWPPGFAPSPRAGRTSEYFLRAWSLAAKRWCWRHARLTLREIVHRRGRLSQTRTDIDITFPLDQADVRIRRAGLDIDPGWLSWFGDYGRVVRFHYRDCEGENNAC